MPDAGAVDHVEQRIHVQRDRSDVSDHAASGRNRADGPLEGLLQLPQGAPIMGEEDEEDGGAGRACQGSQPPREPVRQRAVQKQGEP